MVLILMIMTIVECSASTNKHIPGCKTTPAYLSTAQPKVSFFSAFYNSKCFNFWESQANVCWNGAVQFFRSVSEVSIHCCTGCKGNKWNLHCSLSNAQIVLVKNTISTISWLSNMPSSKLPPSYKVCTGKTHDWSPSPSSAFSFSLGIMIIIINMVMVMMIMTRW